MQKHFKIIIFLFLGFIFSSCATILNGTHQTILINSHPQGATVYIDSVYKGETPLIVSLGRKDENKIILELLGYQNYTTVLNKEISPMFYTNIIWYTLNIFAVPLDYFNGGMYDLTPDNINATLQKSETTSDK